MDGMATIAWCKGEDGIGRITDDSDEGIDKTADTIGKDKMVRVNVMMSMMVLEIRGNNGASR